MATGRRNASSQGRLAPVRNDAELERAIQEIDTLLDKGSALLDADRRRLESLSNAVRRYESVHQPVAELPGAEILRHLLEVNDITARQCANATGVAMTSLSAFLAGKRDLTDEEAASIAHRFCLEASTFCAGPSNRAE